MKTIKKGCSEMKTIKIGARQLSRLIREAVMTSDDELNKVYDELEGIHARLRAAAKRVQNNDEEFDLIMAIIQRMNEITALIDRNRDIGPEHVTRWPSYVSSEESRFEQGE